MRHTPARGGATVSLSYDLAGRMTQQIDPDLGTWVYTYNAMGNLTSRKDARCNGGSCVTINYAYDYANRLTQKGYSIPAGLNVATSDRGDLLLRRRGRGGLRHWQAHQHDGRLGLDDLDV